MLKKLQIIRKRKNYLLIVFEIVASMVKVGKMQVKELN